MWKKLCWSVFRIVSVINVILCRCWELGAGDEIDRMLRVMELDYGWVSSLFLFKSEIIKRYNRPFPNHWAPTSQPLSLLLICQTCPSSCLCWCKYLFAQLSPSNGTDLACWLLVAGLSQCKSSIIITGTKKLRGHRVGLSSLSRHYFQAKATEIRIRGASSRSKEKKFSVYRVRFSKKSKSSFLPYLLYKLWPSSFWSFVFQFQYYFHM